MKQREIRRRFECALRRFYSKEALLIKYKVSERALTHKLAEHLQKLFPRHNVDCEYNKVGWGDPKRLWVLMAADPDCPRDCARCVNNKCVIFPDIIVHRRGTETNLLVVEAKTAWSRRASGRDHEKLAALTASGEYHYQLGIALCFSESCADTVKTIKEYPGERTEAIRWENQCFLHAPGRYFISSTNAGNGRGDEGG